ncbi:riboflavin synthase subunit alpha [Gallibacterium genomosp. 2]|uniref:Riboflavin synthase n=2 Tax=Gallibacterium TaxID=155493 RepID=A0A0A2Y3J9_9PAST|nr:MULTISPECIES: riboflavin synthase [Gallibacterium]KGQ34805.1 riboflavin synthase subunit alpha [Gallibacterium genomosp. 2]KGQ37687.1 riboflavin synthase subunit alpha [Gallibacterium genomosp. 1]OBW99521.1 riboflavin synthase subunit alpha [Gallibacterium genomosp. 1]OBW99764.1 riboflavin synthase subunit alpha [Gallibacterium genomosp. 1]
MFTGIIQGKAKIQEIKSKGDNFRTHVIKMPQDLLAGLALGASVAHNGVCLTVTDIQNDLISFDLMQETLRVTNLGQLRVGDEINVERAMKIGDEVGGHLLSGHVYCTASVAEIIQSPNNCQIWFTLPNQDVMKYILTKGYIAIDGISLTIGEVKEQSFCVNLIPETLQRTIISQKQVGDLVNIELDSQTQAVVDTVERYLSQQK